MNPTDTTQSAAPLKKIFLVEDDAFLGRILSQKIAEHKFDLSLFTTADDALRAMEDKLPDLVLLDIFLPGMNGLDALEQIRKNPKTKDLTVLMTSNSDKAEDRERAAKLGAKFLVKALVTPGGIVSEIEDVLKVK